MPYDVTLAQINTSLGGFSTGSGGRMGFPTGNFSTVLYSQWMCGAGGTSIWPSFVSSSHFFHLSPVSLAGTQLGNPTGGEFFSGGFTAPAVGVRAHLLCSVNTQTQTIQLYINDSPVAVSGSWTGAVGTNWFNFPFPSSIFSWDVAGVISTALCPGIGDVWFANTPGFVDLSVAANRRRFINADLSPVYLGTNGSNPFGYQPQIYCTVQSGGVATDILTNLGTGGGTFAHAQDPPTIQTPGTCTLPIPPPALLALDNVTAFAQLETAGRLIFLDWSDDRAHSWGNPVGQPIGDRGEYLTSVQWQRCGYSRDRTFRLTWSVPVATALLGAYVELDSSAKS